MFTTVCVLMLLYLQVYYYMDYRRHELVANSSLSNLLVSWPAGRLGVGPKVWGFVVSSVSRERRVVREN